LEADKMEKQLFSTGVIFIVRKLHLIVIKEENSTQLQYQLAFMSIKSVFQCESAAYCEFVEIKPPVGSLEAVHAKAG
jgi:hypothetical protein